MRTPRFFTALIFLAATVAATATLAAKIDVKTQRDKDFKFAGVKTYAWHPDGAGEFKLLQATGEDPQALRARFEPVIRKAVEAALAAGGLSPATSGTPDLHVYYYVLIGPGGSSQYMGQFVGGVSEWGLPAFSGATTSFNAFEQGSLILDLSSPALKSMVWRGIAQSEIDSDALPPGARQALRGSDTEDAEGVPAEEVTTRLAASGGRLAAPYRWARPALRRPGLSVRLGSRRATS